MLFLQRGEILQIGTVAQRQAARDLRQRREVEIPRVADFQIAHLAVGKIGQDRGDGAVLGSDPKLAVKAVQGEGGPVAHAAGDAQSDAEVAGHGLDEIQILDIDVVEPYALQRTAVGQKVQIPDLRHIVHVEILELSARADRLKIVHIRQVKQPQPGQSGELPEGLDAAQSGQSAQLQLLQPVLAGEEIEIPHGQIDQPQLPQRAAGQAGKIDLSQPAAAFHPHVVQRGRAGAGEIRAGDLLQIELRLAQARHAADGGKILDIAAAAVEIEHA